MTTRRDRRLYETIVWLERQLGSGRLGARELLARADHAGISRRTLKRARRARGTLTKELTAEGSRRAYSTVELPPNRRPKIPPFVSTATPELELETALSKLEQAGQRCYELEWAVTRSVKESERALNTAARALRVETGQDSGSVLAKGHAELFAASADARAALNRAQRALYTARRAFYEIDRTEAPPTATLEAPGLTRLEELTQDGAIPPWDGLNRKKD